MIGRMDQRTNEGSKADIMGDSSEAMEREVTPPLPTSGQVLGSVVKNLGIKHHVLQSKTARRYFSGRLDDRVKESSRAEIIGAISDVMVDSGFGAATRSPSEKHGWRVFGGMMGPAQ